MAGSVTTGDGSTLLAGSDDLVLPFQAELAQASGRVVRLGNAVDTILGRHDYPEIVSKLLGEAVALTALLGASLKFESKFILQTNTDGPVDLLVVDFEAPGKLRGYARYDEDRLKAYSRDADVDPSEVLGSGHLAMTIDRGQDMDRYQGIVALEGKSLSGAADTYFRQSEQLPTFIRLAVAKHFEAGEADAPGVWHWRAGGLMIQNLTPEGGRLPLEEEESGEAIEPLGSDDEGWTRARLLAETVEDHELLDPLLEPERLLYRLFHEERVRVFRSHPLEVHCSCTKERVADLLNSFTGDEINDMAEDGLITVTCEFCNNNYNFDANDFGRNKES